MIYCNDLASLVALKRGVLSLNLRIHTWREGEQTTMLKVISQALASHLFGRL